MKIKLIKAAKWISLIIAFLLFAYRMYLTNTSSELSDKYYEGSGVKYDASNEGLVVSILIIVMLLLYAVFRVIDELKKESKNSDSK